ncbi:MAG: YmdB family metallophosphoesterase [Clostridia bacterium]|nr:YmdB family metallophosphoesterase [Clostridia bacterium]
MEVLMIGDVVGTVGCEHLRRVLPAAKKQFGIDVCVVNGENAADGNGLTPTAARHILDSGADMITGGNHTFRRPELAEMLDRRDTVLRPANYPVGTVGTGVGTVDKGRFSLTVINLMGQVYMDALACPFETLDRLLKEAGNPRFCVVDFHAEATAEKKALGFYADGRISALVGTHTHVQTADAQILPQGTAFITDVGMTGPSLSVLGVRPEQSIARIKGKLPVRFSTADGPCQMDGVVISLDNATGRATKITPICI